ncbi:MATE family efflux transporter [Lunatibacter salilacus]|uniref:oligosaccharide flippase family protein n=1 Tax=Lunatibacter salilacus TaxID=2483804 RepID=UPI00131E45F3|nr:oligosaccharide flippase family protein [Lunatibacter salilacus]
MESKVKKPSENLRQHAFLNSVTSIVDYAVVQVVGFVVSPFIVRGLGGELFGIWQMLIQMTGFANMADTRATQVLKWSVAKNRDTHSDSELRKEVTSAFVVTLLILPIVLIIGGIIVWYAPIVTKAGEKYYDLVRIVCSLLMFSLVIHKVFDMFESVLRGMNLGFKRMGVRAGIVAVGGGLKIVAITNGYGLIGLSFIEIFLACITGITFYYIVKINVPWFGFGKTNMASLISYGKLSGWFMAFTGSKMFLLSSDKIILGYIAGPIFVTQYTITMFASYALQGIINAVINGVIPGIGGLFGKKEFDKIKKARNLISSLNWFFVFSIGTSILLFNKSFIELWMGMDLFAGTTENLLILLIGLQFVFFQMDSLIINVSLNLKKKVIYSVLSSIATFFLAFWLVNQFGIIGLCLSILGGRLIITFGYPMILKRQMSIKSLDIISVNGRPLLISGLFFGVATYGSQFVTVSSWQMLLALGTFTILIAAAVFWFIGMKTLQRREILDAVHRIELFNK